LFDYFLRKEPIFHNPIKSNPSYFLELEKYGSVPEEISRLEKDSDYLQKSFTNTLINKAPSQTTDISNFDIDRQESLLGSIGENFVYGSSLKQSSPDDKIFDLKESNNGAQSNNPQRKNSVQDMLFNLNNNRKEYLFDDNMETYDELFQNQLKNYLENVQVSDSLSENRGDYIINYNEIPNKINRYRVLKIFSDKINRHKYN
jgi:hypothetical protein